MDGDGDDGAVATLQAQIEELYALVAPQMGAARERLRSGETRLVHYTTASNVLNILQSGEIWLRNVRCMNDYSEVGHGVDAVIQAIGGESNERRDRLLTAFNRLAPGEALGGIQAIEPWLQTLRTHTFIGCFSEHDPEEDHLGRLSLWRAYGRGTSGIALVLNSAPFMAETDELKAYSTPAIYLHPEDISKSFDDSIDRLNELETWRFDLPQGTIANFVFFWLLTLFTSLKHPGFREEREWRIVYSPRLRSSTTIKKQLVSVNSIPQEIHKIPLINDPTNGLFGADPDSLIHRVIIGPTEYPIAIVDAIIEALHDAGVSEPEARIVISDIPLRG
ncbi:DUF2971 domain-containing protein [Sphingomonas sp. LB-2]|uniref:DUF2971 domain-containing protein n=1 Tax=Sphingomonas caeni TaxID=2984949 RepID=UPI002230BEE3|nr:DUF2971 domain-containing protein [Sphingomonas caeni]MCW3846561.1 DUF2971 domain-containing protein [Sphingomonas caeni]